jgi:hypothetical protein
VGVNPSLRAGNRNAIRKLRAALGAPPPFLQGTGGCGPPIQARTGQFWSVEHLKRAASHLRNRLLAATVLERAPLRNVGDRLLAIVGVMGNADLDRTLAGIAARLHKVVSFDHAPAAATGREAVNDGYPRCGAGASPALLPIWSSSFATPDSNSHRSRG